MTSKSSKTTVRYVMAVIYCVFGLAVNGILNFWNTGDRAIPRAVAFIAVIATVTYAVALFVQKREEPDLGIEAFYQLSIGFAIGSGVMGILVIFNSEPALAILLAPFALPLLMHIVDLTVRACMKKELAGRMDGKSAVDLKEPIAAIAFAATAGVVALTLAAVIGLFAVQPWGGFATSAFVAPLVVVPFVLFLVRRQIRDFAFLFGAAFGLNAIAGGMPVFSRAFYLVDGGVIVVAAFGICCLFAAIMFASLIKKCVRNSRIRREANAEHSGG